MLYIIYIFVTFKYLGLSEYFFTLNICLHTIFPIIIKFFDPIFSNSVIMVITTVDKLVIAASLTFLKG